VESSADYLSDKNQERMLTLMKRRIKKDYDLLRLLRKY